MMERSDDGDRPMGAPHRVARLRALAGVRPIDHVLTAAPSSRVIIVSNRLPFTIRWDGQQTSVVPSSGGLATGLRGVHERTHGRWIGWAGAPTGLPPAAQRTVDAELARNGAVGVPLSRDEIAGYYERFANGVLWPALHDRVDASPADPADWATYRAVNERFADVVAQHARPGDQVWIHDYHLMLVPRLLRARRPDVRIGFFLHTPFPTLDVLSATVPQRAALLDGLLGADALGLHTTADVARFVEAVQVVLGHACYANHIADGARHVHIRACPISIDVAAFESRAADPRVARHVARLRSAGGPLFVGVDRLDYTKGIPERLAAFAQLLERVPALRGHARLVQLAVPSREDVPEYRALRARLEASVRDINARFGSAQWTPIEYVYGSVDDATLTALYRAADVMLVTPLRDGMNLVAKEFVASRTDGDGVLVLSERAGAAAELRAALLVDPTDGESLVRAYETALALAPAERRVRMRRLRTCVRRHDVFQWAREFLLMLGGEHAAAVGRTAG